MLIPYLPHCDQFYAFVHTANGLEFIGSFRHAALLFVHTLYCLLGTRFVLVPLIMFRMEIISCGKHDLTFCYIKVLLKSYSVEFIRERIAMCNKGDFTWLMPFPLIF